MLRLDTASLYASSTAASTTASVPAPASDSLQDVPAANDSLPPPWADTVTLSDEGLARLRDEPPPPPPRHDQEELEQTVSSLEAEMDELQQQLSALEQVV